MKKTPTRSQLADLTREEKLLQLDLINEKKRRLRDRRATFKPNVGQMEVLKCTSKVILVAAGNGSGKTTLGAIRALNRSAGYDPIRDELVPVPRRVIVVLDHPDKVRDKWLPEMRKWFNIPDDECHKLGKPFINLIQRPNGSEIKFMFHEQSELVFESIEADDIIFDEPPPRHIYIALLRGMRNKSKQATVMIIATPISGSWLREEIYDPWSRGEAPDTTCFKFSTEVNKVNLPEGYIEWYGSKLSDKEKQVRLHGEFFDMSGLALAHLFKRHTHVIQPMRWPREWPCVVVIDPAPAKAHVAVLLGVDDCDRLYVVDEYREKTNGRTFSQHLVDRGWFQDFRLLDIIYDSLGNSENLMGEGFKPFGVLLNEVLKEHGIGRARATTYNEKDDEDFIERIRDALLVDEEHPVPKLRFFSRCPGAIADIENVQWMQDKQLGENKPKLDIRKRDFLACIKYALATNLYMKKTKESAYYPTKPRYGMSAGRRRV